MKPELSIITVSYNCKPYLEKMILSVQKYYKNTSYEIIVVENNSSDTTEQMVQKLQKVNPNIHMIQLKKTVGFSEANNTGAKKAQGEYLFFLNPDTELTNPTLQLLPKILQQNPNLGTIAPLLLNTDQTYQQQGGTAPSLLTLFLWMYFIDDLPFISHLVPAYQNKQKPSDVIHIQGWIGGTALMISRTHFDRISGWNEAYPLYTEDVDLCYRLSLLHLQSAIYTHASVVHHRNKSGSPESAVVGEFRGLLIFWKLHKPAWQLPLLKFLLWTGAWLRIVIFGILCGDVQRKASYSKAQSVLFMA